MPFTRSSLQVIIERIIADLETRITGATSLLRRAYLRIIAKVLGGAIHLVYEYLDFMSKQLFIATADSAGLDAIAAEYGLTRDEATPATGSGEATGTNGIEIIAGTQLISSDGLTYSTDTSTSKAAGIATLSFTADVAGEDSNDDPSITLSFVSPIIGVNTSFAVDTDGVTGGAEEESDDSLRTKLLRRKSFPPHGGASFDYVTWCLEVDGVTRAWVFPLYSGSGTVGVAFVRDNDTNIIPDAAQIATVRAYLVEHTDPTTGLLVGIPVTAEPGLEMIELSALSQDFTINIFPNTAEIQALVTTSLSDLIDREGGPGETIYISEINQAISLTVGLERHTLVSPVSDQSAGNTQIHTLGTPTFDDY